MKAVGQLSNLKKKLFIVGAYLIVATALVLYVSYSYYRIRIEANVILPEAAQPEAQLSLDYNLKTVSAESTEYIYETSEEGSTLSSEAVAAIQSEAPTETAGLMHSRELVLQGILPGEDAAVYADAYQEAAKAGTLSSEAAAAAQDYTNRMLSFTVSNHRLLEEENSHRTEIRLQYHVVIEEDGPIPLGVILEDAKGNRYYGSSDAALGKREIRFYDLTNPENPVEYVRELSATEDQTDDWKLFFGWNNESAASGDTGETESTGIGETESTGADGTGGTGSSEAETAETEETASAGYRNDLDADLRREVAVLKVKAELVNVPQQLKNVEESVYQKYVEDNKPTTQAETTAAGQQETDPEEGAADPDAPEAGNEEGEPSGEDLNAEQ